MTHVTCRLTAKNRDQLRGTLRSVIEYGLPSSFFYLSVACWTPSGTVVAFHRPAGAVIKVSLSHSYLLTYGLAGRISPEPGKRRQLRHVDRPDPTSDVTAHCVHASIIRVSERARCDVPGAPPINHRTTIGRFQLRLWSGEKTIHATLAEGGGRWGNGRVSVRPDDVNDIICSIL